MPRAKNGPRAGSDPGGTFLRAVRARLDALDGLTETTAEEAAERARLRVIWAHAQPTPALRPARRSKTRRPK